MIETIFFVLMATFIQGQIFPLDNLGITGISPQNITIYLSVILLVSIVASRGQLGRIHVRGISYLVVIFIVVVISVAFLDIYGRAPIDLIDNARSVKNFVFEPFLLYALSFVFVQNRRLGMRYLAIFAAVVGTINIVWLTLASLNINPTVVSDYYESQGRFAGFTGNSNQTAYFLCAFFPIQYFFAKNSKKKINKYFYYFAILSTVLTVLLSGSRGGLIGLIIVAILTARLWGDYKRLVFMPAIVMPIIVSLLFALENDYIVKMLQRMVLLGSGDSTVATSSRIDIWLALLDVYTSNVRSMLIGNGYGISEYIGFGARAHNLYIMILVEFGAIGLILWLVLLRKVVRFIKRLKVYDEKQMMLKKSILITLYLLLVTWIFTTLTAVVGLIGLLFGLTVAVLVSEPNREKEVKLQPAGSGRINP
ncbi:MAG: O-antigen ligase family protein [Gammaproteobacteria bacterium]|nr:O-antigen ligase family protein [Gammaproteobacteria bacterium]